MTYAAFLSIVPHKHNTIAFMIIETANKHYSTQLKTYVWIVSSKIFQYQKVFTGCESEAPDCPCDIGIAPLYSVHSRHCRLTLLFQVQEIVLHKMRCTQSNIWTVLEQCCKYNLTTDFYLYCLLEAQTKYFHNETQHLHDMVPAAATILQRE